MRRKLSVQMRRKYMRNENTEVKETLLEKIQAKQYNMPKISQEQAIEEWAAEMKNAEWHEMPKGIFKRIFL